jgi:hypothetical protein
MITEKPAAPARPPRQRPPRKGKERAKEAAMPDEGPQPVKGDTTLKLLINTDEPEECRLVLLESGKVESFYVETVSQAPRATSTRAGHGGGGQSPGRLCRYGTEKTASCPSATSIRNITPPRWRLILLEGSAIQSVLSKGQEVLVR